MERIWKAGNHVIFDVDVVGGLNIKREYGDAALSVFVMPPTEEHLEKRLRGRLTESEENIQKRLGKSKHEMSFADKFDIVLVNDNLDEAKTKALKLVSDFIDN